ncbi:hypothetical protein BU26DRAFT_464921 [Trematosphaeria pertusa]|uniref:DUF7730 domain-containing protein n=1 Tax=Trematosphaeria pertusa TaxID=390896 RepID=A0A6A6HZT9_9PLEO|nr:uncharacterized protein BU26DRAFT_464921 [Trematosphaeria pertusa]KAF2243591.1 hypothetical protein BU26DRAFT_464921 [Trematosphaeria pertusa]
MAGKRVRNETAETRYLVDGAQNKRRRLRRAGAERLSEASAAIAVEDTCAHRATGLPTPQPSCLTESQPSKECAESQKAEDGAGENQKERLEQKAFPFLKLPAELRVHIYRMALERDEPLVLHLERSDEKSDNDCGECSTRRHALGESDGSTNRDPINAALLRTCSLVYKEARQVLYADNQFMLSLDSGIHTLGALHQRSRSLIKFVSLTIPSHHDILDGFADLVRLGLRYCWGLKKFTIILDAMFPDDRMISGTTSVYANAFHILRWLPRGCKVVLEGNVSEIVRRVVVEEGRLQEELDEESYLKRQHQMPERH